MPMYERNTLLRRASAFSAPSVSASPRSSWAPVRVGSSITMSRPRRIDAGIAAAMKSVIDL
jgi:hypothetical protein